MVRLQDVEIVVVATNYHPCEQSWLRAASDGELVASVFHFVSQVKVIIVLEIAHHIFRCIRSAHLRHAALRPLLVHIGIAAAARRRTEAGGSIVRCPTALCRIATVRLCTASPSSLSLLHRRLEGEAG